MELKYFYQINTGSIAAGATVEKQFIPEADVKIGKIFITERGGATLENVHAYITFMDEAISKPQVQLAIFGTNYETAYPLNKILKAGKSITWKVTNLTAAAVNIDITLECLPP